jgi:histidyl-tRNA synthetase
MKLQTPKGFRDFLPQEALKRNAVIERIVSVFERFGFDPLETPTVEYEETLQGKYGEEERLIYKFQTSGGDYLALKYDQTVPLARVVAQWGPVGAQKLTLPFKRYQIQSAFRGENTQKGRYREFLQCDADIVGISSPLADAEIVSLAYEIYHSLGLDIVIKINDRALLAEFDPKHLSAVDKLNKIGVEGVMKELEAKGLSGAEAAQALNKIKSMQPTPGLQQVMNDFKAAGYPDNVLIFDPTLVRGLDYYTGIIMEVVLRSDTNSSSLCGGGRYDKMIGKFTGVDIPAIGFAIGFDRTVEALEANGLLTPILTKTQALVAIASANFLPKALSVLAKLRKNGINAEIWLDPTTKLEKQLKYTDVKGVRFAVIVGFVETEPLDEVILKDLHSRSQETVKINELVERIKTTSTVIPA